MMKHRCIVRQAGDARAVISRYSRRMRRYPASPKDLITGGRTLPAAVLLFAIPPAIADCLQTLHGDVYCGAGRCLVDKDGKVWCSRFPRGDAEKTIRGIVLCGKGACAKDINGTVLCSSELDGAVFVDAKGLVHCYGRCEAASAAHCEAVQADKVGDAESKGIKDTQQAD